MWLNNQMNGERFILYPNGKWYKGTFVNDKKDGFGI